MSKTHPATRFAAPGNITKGQPLKLLLNAELAGLIGASFAQVWDGFDDRGFVQRAQSGLEAMEMAERGRHMGDALAQALPASFDEALPILLEALGPKIVKGQATGLSSFFYFPHSHYLKSRAQGADGDITPVMTACYELTQRFTSEFCIRPLIERDAAGVLAVLETWARDPSEQVRRLVSEGTRPRLPWATHLRVFIDNPRPMLPLLEVLKCDSSEYVRRSVANHMGDIAKDHLGLVLERCGTWLEESKELETQQAKELRWVIRHALRNPAKREDADTLVLRAAAK